MANCYAKAGTVPAVERRQVWREVYYTLRMFVGIAATWVAIFHEDKFATAMAACSTLYWWYRAGTEGIKP